MQMDLSGFRSHKVADCREVARCWICKSSGHISTYCAFKVLPKAVKGSSFSSSRSPELSLKHSAIQHSSASPSAEMEPIFPNSAIPRITGDCPQEEFSFVAASGEIDEKVVELSNHALVAWEIGLPDDREKVDIHHFAEDFQRHFNVHPLDIQVKKFHPEDFLVTLASSQIRDAACEVGRITVNDAIPKVVWLTISNPDSYREVQHTPALEVAPLPVSFTSLKLAHAYKVLFHIDRIENLTFGSRSSLEQPQCFDWVYGVPDGEVPKYFVRNPDTCSYLKPPRPRDFDKDPEEGSDRSLPPRGKSIWSRIGHQDEPRVIPQNRRPRGSSRRYNCLAASVEGEPKQANCANLRKVESIPTVADDLVSLRFDSLVQSSSISVDPMFEESICNESLFLGGSSQQLVSSLPQTQEVPAVSDVHQQEGAATADAFNSKVQDFLIQISAALPQPILDGPPKVQSDRRHFDVPSASRRSSRLAAKNPVGKGPLVLALEILSRKLGLSNANSSDSPSQKLASLFKHPLSPSAIRAIRELVSLGGGDALLKDMGSQVAAPALQQLEA
ncbi:hypothetical protein GUJ93_ZPchr0002g26535 [Zizania palustris]|uniref:Uncharacterized protein n=1 Tax=Zizania palustris TaxID=103762 RepID=A0A8J5RLZ9_ZIZPA|nr:hypothetical protein GUJ93_ZPchr0002g26535 [Zizania palustris]